MAEKKEKMVSKFVVKTVKIVRDGERVRVPAGKTAKFTEEEVTSINGATPGALRDPVNEVAAADDSDDAGDKKPAKKETAAQKKKRLADEKKAAEEAAAADEGDDDGDDDAGEGDDDDL